MFWVCLSKGYTMGRRTYKEWNNHSTMRRAILESPDRIAALVQTSNWKKRSALKIKATTAASAGCMTEASSMRYAIRPSETATVSAETKTNPIRTGRCHRTESSTPLPSTTKFRKSDIAAADRYAESSHISGGESFVK